MNNIIEAADEVAKFMQRQGWEFCLIGGLAVQRWGEPRTTLDADFVVLAEWGSEAEIIDPLLKSFESRFPDARNFALENRVLLLRASNGTSVDVALGGLSFEIQMVQRATPIPFAPEISIPCCNAEDLFVMKTFSGRPRDLLDAETIVTRQQQLDTKSILDSLAQLADLKGDPEIVTRGRNMLERSK